jgi:hypothetical protein
MFVSEAYLSGVPYSGNLPALLTNMRQGNENFVTNTLAYFAPSPVTKKNCFIRLGPEEKESSSLQI